MRFSQIMQIIALLLMWAGHSTGAGYIACYENKGSVRVTGHVSHKSFEECKALALKAGKAYFGLEYPQGTSTDGKAQCLILDSSAQYKAMNLRDGSECTSAQGSWPKSQPLGNAYRLAVYSLELGCRIGGTTGQNWNWVYEDRDVVGPLKLLSDSELSAVQTQLRSGGDVEVLTDLSLFVQRDDSDANSYVKYIRKDSDAANVETFYLRGGYTDHTNIKLLNDGKQIICTGNRNNHHRCNSLPLKVAVDIVLVEVYFAPRSRKAHGNQWNRNRFTFKGTKYNVAKANCECEIGGVTHQNWNWVYEDSDVVGPLKLLSDSEVSAVQTQLRLGGDVEVKTDLSLYVQRDDSDANSYIKYIRKDSSTSNVETFHLRGGYTDHTNVKLLDGGKQIICTGNRHNHHECNSLPLKVAVDIVLVELYFAPRSRKAHRNQWNRNRFTFKGTKYSVAKANCESTKELACGGNACAYFFDDVEGPRLRDLAAADKFPDSPDSTETITGALATDSNHGDNYGVVVEAWVKAPADGAFVFISRSHDTSQVEVSRTAGSKGDLVTVVDVPARCFRPKERDFLNESDNRFEAEFEAGTCTNQAPNPDKEVGNVPICMEEGQSYYLRAVMKERTGEDYFEIGMKMVDGAEYFPLQSHQLGYVDPSTTPSKQAPEQTGRRFTVAFLSDLENNYRGHSTPHSRRTVEAIRDIGNRGERFATGDRVGKPSLVIHGGDINIDGWNCRDHDTDGGDHLKTIYKCRSPESEFEEIWDVLYDANIPMITNFGNHDWHYKGTGDGWKNHQEIDVSNAKTRRFVSESYEKSARVSSDFTYEKITNKDAWVGPDNYVSWFRGMQIGMFMESPFIQGYTQQRSQKRSVKTACEVEKKLSPAWPTMFVSHYPIEDMQTDEANWFKNLIRSRPGYQREGNSGILLDGHDHIAREEEFDEGERKFWDWTADYPQGPHDGWTGPGFYALLVEEGKGVIEVKRMEVNAKCLANGEVCIPHSHYVQETINKIPKEFRELVDLPSTGDYLRSCHTECCGTDSNFHIGEKKVCLPRVCTPEVCIPPVCGPRICAPRICNPFGGGCVGGGCHQSCSARQCTPKSCLPEVCMSVPLAMCGPR